ncbi:MAG: response regulator transcription factor [Chloracidobacterium sp.]|nr:response regulator transcription factor [Chloracidobacterium sp.]
MRRLIKSVVEDIAMSVYECKDGSEALAAYENHLPEWVVMDIEMNEMNGITATREITELHPEAKILILTKYDSGRIREQAKQPGALKFVRKEDLVLIREFENCSP